MGSLGPAVLLGAPSAHGATRWKTVAAARGARAVFSAERLINPPAKTNAPTIAKEHTCFEHAIALMHVLKTRSAKAQTDSAKASRSSTVACGDELGDEALELRTI